MTLFDIGMELTALDQLCEEAEGNLERAPEISAVLADWFDKLTNDESAKLENYCQYIRQLEIEASAARAEMEQFQKKATTRENRVKWLKDQMKGYLEMTKRERVTTAKSRVISIQKNGGVLPMEMGDVDPKTIDPKFTKLEVDRVAIRMALESGEAVGFAKLGERGRHLRIK